MSGTKQRTIRAIESVTGPLVWERDGLARGTLDGQPIWIEWVQARHGYGFRIVAPLSGRPVTLSVRRRDDAFVSGPEVGSGDAVFDAEYASQGTPHEVVERVLDDSTRTWVRQAFRGKDPVIGTADGFIRSFRDIQGGRPIDGTEALSEIARGMQRLAHRLTRTFDEAHTSIAQLRGSQAAADWAASHARDLALRTAASQQRSASTRVAILLVALVAVGLALAIVAWLVATVLAAR